MGARPGHCSSGHLWGPMWPEPGPLHPSLCPSHHPPLPRKRSQPPALRTALLPPPADTRSLRGTQGRVLSWQTRPLHTPARIYKGLPVTQPLTPPTGPPHLASRPLQPHPTSLSLSMHPDTGLQTALSLPCVPERRGSPPPHPAISSSTLQIPKPTVPSPSPGPACSLHPSQSL